MSKQPRISAETYPWGVDVFTHTEVVPKQPGITLRWRIAVHDKPPHLHVIAGPPGTPATESEITVQLTADQQVDLSVSGQDAYGNPVDISGADAQWASSDESVISVTVDDADKTHCTAVAVGPVGTAAVTVSNPGNTVQGSLAIDVVAGDVTEIVVTASEPTDKPA